MRMMMKVQMDTEVGSKAIADGSMPGVMQATMSRLKPEAAYFGPEGGVRTAFIIFDLADPPEIPSISEPLFSKWRQDHDYAGDEPGGPTERAPAARALLAGRYQVKRLPCAIPSVGSAARVVW